MSDTPLDGPCAAYEFEIVELLDGTLDPCRAGAISAHVAGCARCRAWLARYTQVDAALAAALPRPALSSDFAAKVREKVNAISTPADRGALRAMADVEYQGIVRALGQHARRSAISVGALGVGITTVGLSLAIALRPEIAGLLRSLAASPAGHPVQVVMGAFGAATVLAALAWSALQGVLPGIRLRA